MQFEHGNFELRLGDCLDPVTGLASLGDKSVDHVITDPPYEVEAHTQQRRVLRGAVMEVEPLDFDPISEAERTTVAGHAGRMAKRWVLAFCQVEASVSWTAVLVAGGLSYRRTCVWVKPDGMPQYSGDRPGMGYESIVACHAPGKSTWNGGGQHGVFITNKGGDERAGHPTQKPLALMDKLIRLFTDPGDLICDPFSGSGTTGVAAIRLGRRFVGWERKPEYHAIAMKRLTAAREQLEMFRGAM